MSRLFIHIFILLFVAFISAVVAGQAECAQKADATKCTVIISMKIKPYLEAVEGIKEYFAKDKMVDVSFVYLEEAPKKKWKTNRPVTIDGYKYHAVIALGPEAILFLKTIPPQKDLYKLYSMVLDPASIISQEDNFCGIFLSITAREQIQAIQKEIPEIARLGIIYDPRFNFGYVGDAIEYASNAGLTIEQLRVNSKNDVLETLRKNWKKIDALLMIPDPTVISSSLVRYIIKDGISNNVPSIGYNRFFIKNGALMALVYDYKQIGYRTASLAKKVVVHKRPCSSEAAEFSVVINKAFAKRFGINGGKP